jgi:aryl-alcohol dehydrogenase-like predicted oxidoreductase
MLFRKFGRLGWDVSEVGYGMWGMGGWTGSDDDESMRALDRAIELGCNFFDTAWVYGLGKSETLLGRMLEAHRDRRPIVATKIPPKNMRWPALDSYVLADVYPIEHVREYTAKSLANLGVDRIDLQQFHVWSDTWAPDPAWQRGVRDLLDSGQVRAFGISVNRGEPANVLRALDTGLISAVQVVYNIFDQAAEDELFPYCEKHDIAVIARVPFDEGSLTGTLTSQSKWPDGDWRNIYFSTANLGPTLERVERLRPLVPEGMDLPELAL